MAYVNKILLARNSFTNFFEMQRLWLIGYFLFSLALQGCFDSDPVLETEERAYQRGQRFLKEGRDPEALEAFLKVIAKRNSAPEAHLEAGRLYLHLENDPVFAIYHFRQYLIEKPETNQAPMVKQLIESAQKQFARSLPGQPFAEDLDRLELLECLGTQREDIRQLKEDNLLLQARLAQLQEAQSLSKSTLNAFNLVEPTPHQEPKKQETLEQAVAKSTASQALVHSARTSSSIKTYVVQPGDTLSKISSRVYGTPLRWKEIYDLNRDQLQNEHSLKLGQVLKMP